MVSAEGRAAAVAAQQAQSKSEDAQRAEIQSQIDAANSNLGVPSGSRDSGTSGQTFAQIQLQKLYKESGVVQDSRGNVLYNPADLGAAREAEQARKEGRPTPILTGQPSEQYLKSVAATGGNIQDITKQRSALSGLAAEKRQEAANLAARESEIQRQIEAVNSQINAPQVLGSTYIDKNTGQKVERYQSQYDSKTLDRLIAQRKSLEAEQKGIKSRRTDLGIELGNISAGEASLLRERTAAASRKLLQNNPINSPLGIEKKEAGARIKSVVRPVANTPLAGSSITARDLLSAKGNKKAQQNLQQILLKEGELTESGAKTGITVFPERPERVKAQTGQPGALFGNVNFNQKGAQQSEKTSIDVMGLGSEFSILPLASAESALAQTRITDKDAIEKVRRDIRNLESQGAKTVMVTDAQGNTKEYGIRQAPLEALRALRSGSVSLSASVPSSTTQYTIGLTENLSFDQKVEGGVGGPAVVDLANPPRQITATSILQREEKKTGLNLSALAPAAKGFDDFFQLNQPKELRSQQTKDIFGIPKEIARIPSNRDIAELSAPIVNFGASVFDLTRQTAQTIQGKVKYQENKPFQDPSNIFGLPTATNYERLPIQETAAGRLLEGKPVDLSARETKVSFLGEAAFFAIPAIGTKLLGKASGAVKERIQIGKETRQLEKDVQPLREKPITQERPLSAVEPTIGKAGQEEVSKFTIFKNIVTKPETTQPGIRVTKTTNRGVYGLESETPITDLTTPVKNVISYVTPQGTRRIGVLTNELPGTPKQYVVRGSLSRTDLEALAGEPKASDAISVFQPAPERYVLPGTAKSAVEQAVRSKGLSNTARFQSFEMKDVLSSPKLFSDFLFGKSQVAPGKAVEDIQILTTRGFGSVGTRVATEQTPRLAAKASILEELVGKTFRIGPEQFTAYTKPKTVTTAEKRTVRNPLRSLINVERTKTRTEPRPTDTFVAELTRFGENPFAKKQTRAFKTAEDFLGGDFGLLGKTEAVKGKQVLTKQKATEITNDLVKLTQEPTVKPKQNYGSIVIPSVPSRYETVEETLRFPPGTEFEGRPKKGTAVYGLGGVSITKLGSELMPSVKPDTGLRNKPDLLETFRDKLDIVQIGGLDITQISPQITGVTPITDQTTKQGQKEIQITKTVPITTTITPQITTEQPPPGTPGFPKGDFFYLPRFRPGGYGGGGMGGKKRSKKTYTITSTDPYSIGTIFRAGVEESQTSISPKIFAKGERDIRRARKRKDAIDPLSDIVGKTFDSISLNLGAGAGKKTKSNIAAYAFKSPSVKLKF